MRIRWKGRDAKKADSFCAKAIEFWEIIRSDPKNRHRKNEIDAFFERIHFAIPDLLEMNETVTSPIRLVHRSERRDQVAVYG